MYGVALGADAKRRMSVIINELRANGIACDMSFGDRGLKGAMKGANRSGARFALVLGEQELGAGTIAVKDMAAQEQKDVALDDVVSTLRSQLQN